MLCMLCVYPCCVLCAHPCCVCCVYIRAVCCMHAFAVCVLCAQLSCVCVYIRAVCCMHVFAVCVLCAQLSCMCVYIRAVCCAHTRAVYVVCTSVLRVCCLHICAVCMCVYIRAVCCVHTRAVCVVCVHFDAHSWLRDPWPLPSAPWTVHPLCVFKICLRCVHLPQGIGGAIPSVGMDTQARLRGQPAAEQGVPASILKCMLSGEHHPGPLILSGHGFGLFPRHVPLPTVHGRSGLLTAVSTHSVLSPSTRVHRRQFPGFSLNQSDS